MALSLFKKSEPVSPVAPALAALHAHLDVDQGIVHEIERINARLRIINDDINAAASMSAAIRSKRESIDARLADARYSDAPAPDVTADRQALAQLEKQFERVAELARVGQVVKPKLQADIEALTAKRTELRPTSNRLLYEAALEEGASHAAEYLAAREAMRRLAHKAFAPFVAAEGISKTCAFGGFFDAVLFHDLFIPLPNHPAYRTETVLPEAAKRARYDDGQLLEREAGELVERLLNRQ
jgi:hypothetical protein